jgi:hypothetical protein
MLLPIDVSFVQEVQLPVHDGLVCPKHALSDLNPGSWLVMEETSRLHFEGRRLLPMNDATWCCHLWTQVLQLVGVCRNEEQQLVVRHLWCTDHLLGFLVWGDQVQLAIMRDTPHIITEPPPYGTVGWMHLGVYAVFYGLQTFIRPSVTWIRNRLSSDQWILCQVLKFKPRRVKHHAKCNRWCRYDNFGRLITLLDLSLADFKRFLSVLTDRHIFGNHYLFRTGLDGCELQPSDQAMQCPVFTLLRYM